MNITAIACLPARIAARKSRFNGQPALLVRGNWASQGQWDASLGLTLYWTNLDGRFYRLIYSQRDPVHNRLSPLQGDAQAITQELIRMAESVP